MRAIETVSPEEMTRQKCFAEAVRELPHRPESYFIVTYGCQMNAHDSEKIAGMLEDMGMTPAMKREEADFVIFNTCCVRDNAERRALGNITWLKEVRKSRPHMMIAVCGCMIQEPGMAEKILKQYRFINLAFGTANLHRFPELMLQALESDRSTVVVDDRDVIPEGLPIRRLRKDAAYVTIMYGCDNFCSYCIVPYVRGRERSRDPIAVLKEVESLADNGIQEIMLLGQNVNSYGKGLSSNISFAWLLREVEKTGIPRIRFMTSHPKDLSDELIDTMAESSHILPQFHLPVQSGSNRILEKMNRHYTRERYLDRVQRLREAVPDIGLSTDIIVGFPGETEEDFLDTLDVVRKVCFDSAFTFIYSKRTGTRAAEMPNQVPKSVSQDRLERLLKVVSETASTRTGRLTGSVQKVLVEEKNAKLEGYLTGRLSGNSVVHFKGPKELIGSFVNVRLNEAKGFYYIGELEE